MHLLDDKTICFIEDQLCCWIGNKCHEYVCRKRSRKRKRWDKDVLVSTYRYVLNGEEGDKCRNVEPVVVHVRDACKQTVNLARPRGPSIAFDAIDNDHRLEKKKTSSRRFDIHIDGPIMDRTHAFCKIGRSTSDGPGPFGKRPCINLSHCESTSIRRRLNLNFLICSDVDKCNKCNLHCPFGSSRPSGPVDCPGEI